MSGMGNPCLAYISQTAIVGDSSQEFVVVRNMAQHWTGAIVTNNNWEDIWINEGFTTYIERLVLGSVDSQNYAYTEAYVGNTSLAQQTNVIGIVNETYASLHPVLHGQNPDVAFSIVPFEKGFQLLWYIEQSVLDYYMMQDFVSYYINMNNLMSICAFRERLTFSNFVESMIDNADQVNYLLSLVDYEMWIYEVGLAPQGNAVFANSQTDAATSLANAYCALGGASSPAGATDYQGWPSNQKVVFCQTMLSNF